MATEVLVLPYLKVTWWCLRPLLSYNNRSIFVLGMLPALTCYQLTHKNWLRHVFNLSLGDATQSSNVDTWELVEARFKRIVFGPLLIAIMGQSFSWRCYTVLKC